MDIINCEVTKEVENKIWREAVIIFDTSSLLNIYDLSDNSKEDFIQKIIVGLKHKIWLPYYVLYEYNKNRYKPINKTIELYKGIQEKCSKMNEEFKQIVNNTKDKDKHPIIENKILSEFEPELQRFKEKFDKEIELKVKTIEKTFENDNLKKSIDSNITIGEKFSFKEIQEIIDEGNIRYQHKIPPGYQDIDKIGFQKFADLIIWKEILKYSSSQKKSIIFVVDDNKEDWWVFDKKRNPLKPREELVYEICESSNIDFLMYNLSSFTKTSERILNLDFLEKTLDEVELISLIDSNNIFYKGIKLSSDSGSGSNEQHRIERLSNVVDFIMKRNNTNNILELNDHKGMLSVYWKQLPTLKEKSTAEDAWEHVYEIRQNVEHITKY